MAAGVSTSTPITGLMINSGQNGQHEMYTQFDKVIVTLIMAVVSLLNYAGIHFGLSESTVTLVVTTLTPVLVWIIPNLPKDTPQ